MPCVSWFASTNHSGAKSPGLRLAPRAKNMRSGLCSKSHVYHFPLLPWRSAAGRSHGFILSGNYSIKTGITSKWKSTQRPRAKGQEKTNLVHRGHRKKWPSAKDAYSSTGQRGNLSRCTHTDISAHNETSHPRALCRASMYRMRQKPKASWTEDPSGCVHWVHELTLLPGSNRLFNKSEEIKFRSGIVLTRK